MSDFNAMILKFVLWVGGIALVVGGVLRIWFVSEVEISHNGMAPTLLAGDVALMWRDAAVEMGDVAVCRHPEDDSLVIGRMVAQGGMTVKSVRGGQLWVQGTTPDRDAIGVTQFYDSDEDGEFEMRRFVETFGNTEHETFYPTDYEFRLDETEVPSGEVFLLGDNRQSAHSDSRTFGSVQPQRCLGVIFMRLSAADDGGADLGHGVLDIID